MPLYEQTHRLGTRKKTLLLEPRTSHHNLPGICNGGLPRETRMSRPPECSPRTAPGTMTGLGGVWTEVSTDAAGVLVPGIWYPHYLPNVKKNTTSFQPLWVKEHSDFPPPEKNCHIYRTRRRLYDKIRVPIPTRAHGSSNHVSHNVQHCRTKTAFVFIFFSFFF